MSWSHVCFCIIIDPSSALYIFCSPEPCPITACNGYQRHIKCDAKCRIDDELDEHGDEGWGLLRHQGVHSHEWAEVKKADPIAKEKLKERVIQDPKTGPIGHKVRVLITPISLSFPSH